MEIHQFYERYTQIGIHIVADFYELIQSVQHLW
ncbi:hypothetical protein XTGART2_1073 [Xanthomonas translucens pv. graminis]|uniref:Uncharacterized protein n=1 Tax=Xanthomonas graminis pv. graminis TaxID=134874 RepID=A0A1M4IDY9_9XANT|nr:hypothetical protein XTG29_00850 [Xanthomonas translucens pv. graminis ART-Xtg29]SBV40445.1 hypothetical protein XTGART2_1073 [Xanthomonas translucens pv. graminis]SBV40790.1 hypothetical protein XTGART9_1087 [Xanthomonas translucens pv. graminis]SBV46486.1 hypothetical protein XTGART29_1114 [Xanthomonas translucens pv. graminis ART-Xtg29]SBV54470.1 hypothetical protein XTGART10_1086 [Xanthomonas translucens pv. graminis]